MPDTTPRGIQFPVPGDQITDLDAKFGTLASTADDAIGAVLVLPARWMSKTGGSLVASDTWSATGGWTDDTGSSSASGIAYSSGAFTVSEDGIYRAYLSWAWASDASTGLRACRLIHNGNAIVALGGMSPGNGASGQLAFNCEVPRIQLASNDTITSEVFQSTGGSLAPSSATGSQTFAIEMLQPL